MKWDECFSTINDSLFRIEFQCSSGIYIGTGFVVAKYKVPDKIELVLATAKHLLEKLPSYEYIHWKIEKFDIKGNIIDSLTFKTNLEETGESLMRLNLDFDIASLYLPKLKKQYSPLRVIDSRCAIGPGTKVGWAGFPMFAEIKIQRKNPCYFEGVISTTVEDNGKLFYLVDGHGGKGISGGPLWYWNEEESNYEIIGVCNQYVLADDNYLPGLVSFQSINPLISYLKVDNVMDINEIIAEEFPRN